MKLIVNADDLGATSEINAAVFEGMNRGVVTSATAIGNASRLKQAGCESTRFPQCSFGVHLNITTFPPLTNEPALKKMLDERGWLVRDFTKPFPTPMLLNAVYREWCAQVEAVARAGFEISHFDSHHHIHTRWQLFPVLKAVQKRFGIRRVRLTRNFYVQGEQPSQLLLLKKRLFNTALQSVYRTRVTDSFCDFLSFHQSLGTGRGGDWISMEVMVHPGASYCKNETEILMEGSWVSRLPEGCRLCSFREL